MPISKHRRRHGRPGSRAGGISGNQSVGNARKKKKTNYLYVTASAVIAVLVIGGFALSSTNLGQSGFGQAGRSNRYVEDVGERQPVMPSTAHIPEGQVASYNTVPPTSGEMWARTENCGFYEDGRPDELVVHNLEHGNIVVSYNLSAQEEVEELKDAIDDIGLSNIWGVTRSYDHIPEGEVALAAWGVLDVMDGVDPDRINRFFDTYAGNLGPERGVC